MTSPSAEAARHAADIVRLALKHDDAHGALVVFDARSPLSRLVTDAYRAALPDRPFIDFDATTPTAVVDTINALAPGDLVVLIQSQNFRLTDFRFRIEMFQRGLAVIEHVNLERAADDRQIATYVDAMAYDPGYYLPLARSLKERIDAAKIIEVRCAGTLLTYEGGMEETKLNVGDYAGMKNVGGTFPIGEVFSEPRDFSRVHGEVMLFAFAGFDHLVQIHAPFKARIEDGILVSHDGPEAFEEVLTRIRADEEVLVREFGLGLNPAMGKGRTLADITAFERQKGLHLSLGKKHSVYKKPGYNQKKAHFHVDVFVDVERIRVDDDVIWQDGDFVSAG